MIRGLWDIQSESIIDVKLGDSEADANKYEPIVALLAWWETIKNNNNGKHCNNQRKQFSPFVISMDGILGRKDLVLISNLSQAMDSKRSKPVLQVWGWVNSQIAIAVVRS